MNPRFPPLLLLALLAPAAGAATAAAPFPSADGVVLALRPLPSGGDSPAPAGAEHGEAADTTPDESAGAPGAGENRTPDGDDLQQLDQLLYGAGEHPDGAPATAGEDPENAQNGRGAHDRREESEDGTRDRNAEAPGTAPGGGEPPGTAGPSAAERRSATLDRARVLLEEIDETLHGAQRQAQDRRDREPGGAPPPDDGEAQREDAGEEDDGPPTEAVGDESGDAEQAAEGEVPGNGAAGKSGRRHGYNEDDDLVTRQVCEMAETEPDPEVRASLKERCRELRQG